MHDYVYDNKVPLVLGGARSTGQTICHFLPERPSFIVLGETLKNVSCYVRVMMTCSFRWMTALSECTQCTRVNLQWNIKVHGTYGTDLHKVYRRPQMEMKSKLCFMFVCVSLWNERFFLNVEPFQELELGNGLVYFIANITISHEMIYHPHM